MKGNEELDKAIKLLKEAHYTLYDLYGCYDELTEEITSFIKVVEDNKEKRKCADNIKSKDINMKEELDKIFYEWNNTQKERLKMYETALARQETEEELNKIPTEVKMGVWLNKKYDIYYSPFNDNYNLKFDEVKHITGLLMNYDKPFTGRFFIEDENGSLTIIPMTSVVLMTEAKTKTIKI